MQYTIIGSDGREYGPATEDQLKAWLAESRIGWKTKIRTIDSAGWQTIGDFPNLAGAIQPPVLASTPPPFIAAPATSSQPHSPKKPVKWWVIALVGLLVVGFLMSLDPSSAGGKTMTKAEWIQTASAAGQMLTPDVISVQKDRLYRAVGTPTSTQSVGSEWYFYWDCEDGRIQLRAPNDPDLVGGVITAHLNTF